MVLPLANPINGKRALPLFWRSRSLSVLPEPFSNASVSLLAVLCGCRSFLLPEFALACPGLAFGDLLPWALLMSLFLDALLMEPLIAFDREGIVETQEILQGSQIASFLEMVDGKRVAQHGGANEFAGDAYPNAEAIKQLGDSIG